MREDNTDLICAGLRGLVAPLVTLDKILKAVDEGATEKPDRKWAIKVLQNCRQYLFSSRMEQNKFAAWAKEFDRLFDNSSRDFSSIYPTLAAEELAGIQRFALSDQCLRIVQLITQALGDSRFSEKHLEELGKLALESTKVDAFYSCDASNRPNHAEKQEVRLAFACYYLLGSRFFDPISDIEGMEAWQKMDEAEKNARRESFESRTPATGPFNSANYDLTAARKGGEAAAFDRFARRMLELMEAAPEVAE